MPDENPEGTHSPPPPEGRAGEVALGYLAERFEDRLRESATGEVDERFGLVTPALHLRDLAGLTDSDSWLYFILARLGAPSGEHVVGGHAIASLAPAGQPSRMIAADVRTAWPWDRRYDGYIFEACGLIIDAGTDVSAYPPSMVYPLAMNPVSRPAVHGLITLVVRIAQVRQRDVSIFGRAQWRPDWEQVEHSYVGIKPGRRKENTAGASEGLRLWAGIPLPKRGPTRGTVKAAKYKSPEQWYAAIREKVLTRKTLTAATDDETIAFWLDISPTTMYRRMRRWGPKTLEDLRNGKFNCNCHGCRP